MANNPLPVTLAFSAEGAATKVGRKQNNSA
jgi:hypothetical protein